MNVDLLIPRFPPAHWNFAFAMDVEGSKYSHPPLGALTLAAYTPPGIEMRLFDENLGDVRLDELADCVGISAMYIQRERAFELARALRRRGKRVLLGGGVVHALPERCANEADVVFHGEGELTWPQFCRDLQRDEVQPSYRAEQRFDMSQARTPRYDLLPMEAYSTGSIQTSRGCPYSCDFCDVPFIDGPRSRTKTVDQVMTEVDRLFRGGLRSIFIVDDHFLGDRKFAMKLLAELARYVEGVAHKLVFYCQATLNVAKDEAVLEALYRANFRRLFIGIESIDSEALRNVNKPHNLALPIVEAVRRIQRHNITVWAALLMGFDEDGPERVDEYLAFVREANIAMVIPGLLQAVPGTPYYEHIRKSGRLVPLRNGYVGGQAGSLDSLLTTNVTPERMSKEELVAGYQRLARALYEHSAFADRLLGFLEAGTLPELGQADAHDIWDARHILVRAARHYLIDGDTERRRFFLRVIAQLAKNRFRRVDEAIFHLVLYKHLRQFYFTAADATVPIAHDLRPAVEASPTDVAAGTPV